MQQNFLEPTEPAEPPEQAENLSELLRIGKDEMNLAEFPLTLLSDRANPEQTSLKFEDQIYDDRKRKLITRKRIVEGSKEYGLPTATDDVVILALIQLTKLKNGFTSGEIEFTRHELIAMLGWPNKGQSYDRIALSLHRIAGVTYHFDHSWWDNQRKAWTTKVFGIIDTVELNDSREADGQGGLFPSRIIWNKVVFDSFQAGYLRSIDFQLAINLKHTISLRIYRFMGKRFHLKPEWDFELRDFACEHIGLGRNYEGGAQLARKLEPALAELEQVGFLEPLPKSRRFTKKGQEWSIRLIQKAPALPALAATVPDAGEALPPLAKALASRGVTEAVALELVQRFPAKQIEAQIAVFDWLSERSDKRLAKSPAGYLVTSIQKNYKSPAGFASKEEQQRQAAAKRQQEQEAAEGRRRRQQERARQQAEREAIAAYWEALTPEQQAELDATARSQADPDTLKLETGPMKRLGQHVRREAYIRHLLQDQGSLPPSE